MSNLLLISNRHPQSYVNSGRYYALFNLMKSKLDFRIEVCSNYNVCDIEEDIIMIFKSPENDAPYAMSNLANLPEGKKLISYYSDIHTSGNSKEYLICMERLLKRSNSILCSYHTPFTDRWKIYKSKYEFFPHFVDHNIYSNLEINSNPKMQCFVSGSLGRAYPFRKKISVEGGERINILPHPTYRPTDEEILKNDDWKIGIDYAQEINNHFCGLATSGNMRYVVAKYFEIPAGGSLLLGEYIPDLDKLGFIDHKNYIAVNMENFFDILDDVLSNPYKYEDIRKRGQEFVLNNYTEEHSFDRLERILND